MMVSPFFWFSIFTSFVMVSESARILGISCFPSVSHQATLVPIWKELSLRGHKVTALITNPLNDDNLTNLTEIDVSNTYEIPRRLRFAENAGNQVGIFKRTLFIRNVVEEILVSMIENEEVQKLIRDKKQEFDVILVEPHHPLIFAFAARFKAPVIGISSAGVLLEIHDVLGNPTHPAITPDIFFSFEVSPFGPPFLDRVNSFFYNIWYRALYHWYLLPKADGIARKYFGDNMPYVGEIVQNISLLLTNSNPIMHTIRPYVPKVVEIGQLHIKKEKTALPKDLQEYLDKSKSGVIYFSLGTNVLASNLQKDMIKIINDALSELPYDVIWKWEKDVFTLPKPKNVMLRKWLPQQDLLGHPNLKVFVMQGGIQSTEEAIINGVPMVGLPFVGDQQLNVQRLEQLRIGKGVDTKNLRKEALRDAILQVAKDQRYKERIFEVKKLLMDQPIQGMEKAIWWIEYVIRHKGAAHLQAPAGDLSYFQYFMGDVVLFLLAVIIFVYIILRQLLLFVCRGKSRKTKTD